MLRADTIFTTGGGMGVNEVAELNGLTLRRGVMRRPQLPSTSAAPSLRMTMARRQIIECEQTFCRLLCRNLQVLGWMCLRLQGGMW